jgi:tetratricopeptide (TPR) repeat protein
MKKSAIQEKGKVVKPKETSAFDGKKLNRRINLFFFILCFLIYGKSVKNNYSMDDEYVVRNNVQVQQGIKAIPEIFQTTYVTGNQKANYEYRPIVKTFFAIECQFFGVNPHISHFFNILLYALSILLLYYLLKKLLSDYSIVLPFIITTLFLIHPLHSEVVISIKNRDVILSFIGALLALFFYLKFTETRKYHYLFLGAFFMLFALMSKKDAMTFFAIIPFTIWFFKGISVKRMIPVFLSYLLTLGVFRLAARHANQEFSRKVLEWENPLFLDSTVLERIPTGLYSVYFYLKMFLFPQPLVSYYGYNQVPISTWSDPIVWIVLGGLIAIGYYVAKNFKAKRIEVYGILFFLVTISMFTNILVPVVGIVGERFAYIPSLGLCIVLAWALFEIFKIPFHNRELEFPPLSGSLFMTLAVLILVLGLRSFVRIKDWKDTYTLYAADVKNAPESAHANSLIAAASLQKLKENPRLSMAEKKQYIQDAEKYYLESIRIIPDYISSLNNLGMIYYTYFNQPEKSIAYLKKAVLLDTNYVEAYFNLATCEAKTGRFQEAEQHFLKTLELDPDFLSTYHALSNMYAEAKEYDKIIELNTKAINKGIKADVLQINIGNVYFMRGDTLKALPYLEEGIKLNPNNRPLNSFLANYYREKGDMEKARKYSALLAQ